MGDFRTGEPYLAVPLGGQVAWWTMRDGPPQVMTELGFTVRPAVADGDMRDISLILNLAGLTLLADRVNKAVVLAAELAESMAAHPPPEQRKPPNENP